MAYTAAAPLYFSFSPPSFKMWPSCYVFPLDLYFLNVTTKKGKVEIWLRDDQTLQMEGNIPIHTTFRKSS